jgi:hypothetical protein
MRGLVWFVQGVRAPPPARARRCGPRAARRRGDGAFSVDGEGRCACGIGMVEAVWAAGLCGCCGESAGSGQGTGPTGDARREEGLMRVSVASVNAAVGFDILGLLGAMFVCQRRPHKIRLLLVHRHFSGALGCFGHAFVSFRSRTCSFRTLLAQACMLMLFYVVQTWRVMSGMAELGIAQALCGFCC